MRRVFSSIFLLVCIISAALIFFSPVSADDSISPERGKYIYDDANRLPFESELAVASYLWRTDQKTNYEMVIVFPTEKMDEDSIINWFNKYGVGKEKKDTGAAIFVFPDNSVFVAIGSGNDKVSVSMAKTYGEKIFKDIDKDLVLCLLRFTNVLAGNMSDPLTTMRDAGFNFVKENAALIFLWALVLVTVVFLLQLINGFQWADTIFPIILAIITAIVVWLGSLGVVGEDPHIKSYGIMTSSVHDTRFWVETRVISDGKTTTTITIPHTDYINKVSIQSYDFGTYLYTFKTTDNRGAWSHVVGEVDYLEINRKSGGLRCVSFVNDNSGGKTIGDGVWINRK